MKSAKESQKLQIFRLIQKNLASIGIEPGLTQQVYPINRKISMVFVFNIFTIVSNLVYVISDAKTFADYTQSIYIISIVVLVVYFLVILIIKVDKLFEFIHNCGKIVNSSEYRMNVLLLSPKINKQRTILFSSIEIYGHEVNILW